MKYSLHIESGERYEDPIKSITMIRQDGFVLSDLKGRQNLKGILENPRNEIYIYDSLTAVTKLRRAYGVSFTPAGDPLILALMTQHESQDLEDLFEKYAGAAGIPHAPAEGIIHLEFLMTKAHPEQLRAYRVELNLVPVLAEMTVEGIPFNSERFIEVGKEISDRLEKLYAKMVKMCGREFTTSSKDIKPILFDVFKLEEPPIRTKGGALSLSKEALSFLDHHEWVRDLMELKHLSSVLSSGRNADYNPVLIEGLAHPEFRPLNVSGSARIYTSDPAVNQLPTEFRDAIQPQEGYKFLYVDWSGAELILLAYLANEKSILNVYKQGGDVHRYVTGKILGIPTADVNPEQREISKIVTFSIVYGSTGGAASRAMQISYEEAAKFVDKFLDQFPAIKKYRAKLVSDSRKSGTAKTFLGRTRKIPQILSHIGKVRAAGERQAMNTPIQNGVADLQKIALRRLWRYLPENCRTVFTVFDSFLIQVPISTTIDEMMPILKRVFRFLTKDFDLTFNFEVKEGYSFGRLQQ